MDIRRPGTSANWATYETRVRRPGRHVSPLQRRQRPDEDIDDGFLDGKKFDAAMGEEGMKKLDELYGLPTVASSDTELFSINPKQSYPPDEWVKAYPDFWKPKAAVQAPRLAAKPAWPKPGLQ